jgi:fermentation-respiration switch protein FrsA (DUF1100 family)
MSDSKKKLLAYSLPTLAAAVTVGAGHVLRKRFQRRYTFLPDRYPNGVWNPRDYGLPAEDVWFFSGDGEELHGWWVPHPRARGTLLYCHGNSGSIGQQIKVLTELHRLKMNLFAFDYRGYGRSTGEPSESGVLSDARAAYDHLVGTLGQSPEEILLFGHSLGGAVAIDCAGAREVAGLVVQSSFMDTRHMAREIFPQIPVHLVASRRFRNVDKVPSLRMPKLFIHGSEDGTVPVRHGRGLFEAAAEPKELFVVDRAGHNDVHRHGGQRYRRRLSRFRDRCLED